MKHQKTSTETKEYKPLNGSANVKNYSDRVNRLLLKAKLAEKKRHNNAKSRRD
jgi:hypothetical protein